MSDLHILTNKVRQLEIQRDELLAALKECEEMLDEFDANSDRTQRIRAAIAKAESS